MVGQRLLATLLLAAACQGVQAAGHCKLARYGTLPVTMDGLRPVVAGTINGQPVRLMADSGAFFSTLSSDAAKRLGMRMSGLPEGMEVQGVGGEERARRGVAREFTLDGLAGKPIRDIEFVVGGNAFANGIDGVLGQNVLGFADIEYDLAGGTIQMMKADDCRSTNLAYWAGDKDVAVFRFESTTPAEPHLFTQARLNGKSIRLLLDTGASTSTMTLQAARRAGFDLDDPKVQPGGLVHGLGDRSIESWIARFDELDLGGEAIRNAQLRVADFDLPSGADMLLGADFFLSHHLYISRDQRNIYFTFNGGHVFDLSQHDGAPGKAPAPTGTSPDTAGATPAAATLAAGTPAGDASPADPAAAAELRRRASAEAARGELKAALSDLDDAIRKAPADGATWYQRAQVGLRMGAGDRALKDLDRALELAPSLVDARMLRAQLRLQERNPRGADEDFDAAISAAPGDSAVPLLAAQSQLAFGDQAAGMARLDAWIAGHPGDNRLPGALDERCRSRAHAGRELEKALEDCNEAIRRGRKNSEYLDDRGLVWLRMGMFARADVDFGRAVELQPKQARSLYGLGLAEVRSGRQAQGQAHIRAATALDAGIAESYLRMGLAP